MRRKLALAPVLAALALSWGASADAATLPPGFQESIVFSGLTNPTVVRFSPDGRVFVAEKSGLIKVFDNLTDPTPTVFADLSTNVHNFWDRGLLGMTLDPGFPATPYVYVLYAHDAAIGGTAPRWGTPGVLSDPCPTPPGATADGCVVSGRLSRLQAAGNTMTGTEQVLIEDWCQQYPSHSVGSLAFGADGALYVSGGDGASFNFADWGQDGSPLNPCGDPPGGAGSTLTPPTAEGGALRSQDLRTSGDPTSLDGALLRVDPATGRGCPTIRSRSAPTRTRGGSWRTASATRSGSDVRPRTSEVWVGDVGWNTWEEIDRVDPAERRRQLRLALLRGRGPAIGLRRRQPEHLREPLRGRHGRGDGALLLLRTTPRRSSRARRARPAAPRPPGLAFYDGGNYPAATRARSSSPTTRATASGRCGRAPTGCPIPLHGSTFAAGAANPVDVQIGPGRRPLLRGLRRRHGAPDPLLRAPTGPRSRSRRRARRPARRRSWSPSTGPARAIRTRATRSPTPGTSTSDGLFDDSTAAQPTRTYTAAGSYVARLRVTDAAGASAVSRRR